MSKPMLVGEGEDSWTTNENVVVPALPSTPVTSAIDSVGAASSLTIVPVACASATVAPLTLVTLTNNVSFGSGSVSPFTVTANRTVSLPAGITVPGTEPVR